MKNMGMTEDNRKHNKEKTTGHVFLVGAGPGRRDLITVAGLELLRQCDVLVYDRLCGEELPAEAREGCERIYAGKRAGHHSRRQDEINDILIRKAKEGLRVVRLKGGDPFVFGRGGEEAESLMAAGIPFTVVPGVTSAVAVPELAGIPVTHRQVSRSFHVITAHTAGKGTEEGEAWLRSQIGSLKDAEGTFVFLMGLSGLDLICGLLQEYGRPPGLPAAVIGNGTRYNEIIVRGTLADIGEKVRREGVTSPAMIVVGETAALSLRSEWQPPLSGVRIGLVGTESLTEKLGKILRQAGAETLPVQTLSVKTGEDGAFSMADLSSYTWVVFTSGNGVNEFFRRLILHGRDIRTLAGLSMAVIGSGTAQALEERGIRPDFMPDVYTAEHLARGLADLLVKGKDRVLLWQAKEGNPILEQTLRRAGVDTVRIHAYETVADRRCTPEEMASVSYLAFASSSGVRAFCSEDADIFRSGKMEHITAAAIGSRTAAALKDAGCGNCLTARTFTAQGLADAIIADHMEKAPGTP